LSSLKNSLLAALERLQKNGGFVRIVLLSPQAPELFLELKQKFAKTFDFFLAQTHGQVKHFIVCDSLLARIEEPHAPLTPQTPANDIRAKVYFNEPEQATRLESQFDYIWELLQTATANK